MPQTDLTGPLLPATITVRVQQEQPPPWDEETTDLLARIDEAAVRYLAGLKPTSTWSAYEDVDWKRWQTFTTEAGLPVNAVTPGTLVMLVKWMWERTGFRKKTRYAPSTIDRNITGVVVYSKVRYGMRHPKEIAGPARELLAHLVDEMPKSNDMRGTGQAPPLRVRHMRIISRHLETPTGKNAGRLDCLRNRAMMLMQFAVAGREHELAWLRVAHVELEPRGMVVHINVSKNDPRKVTVKYEKDQAICPVRAHLAYVEAAGIADLGDTFLYRQLHPRWATLTEHGMSPKAVGEVLTRIGERAGVPIRFTGHSPRRGLASEGRKAGKDRKAIAAQGGWADRSRSLDGYFEIEDSWSDNALDGVLRSEADLRHQAAVWLHLAGLAEQAGTVPADDIEQLRKAAQQLLADTVEGTAAFRPDDGG